MRDSPNNRHLLVPPCRATIELLNLYYNSRPRCWASGPMAGQEPSRVPHDAAVVAGAVARPKPLWQPWSDSDDDRESTSRSGENHRENKELPTRTKKERRRHERHLDLLSTAARVRKERAAAAAPLVPMEPDDGDGPLDMSTGRRNSSPSPPSYGSHPLRYPSPPDYSAARPSVITCASSLRSSPAPSCPSPCGSTGSGVSSSSAPQPCRSPPRSRPAADGMCDPVIDEHFRRSLGERYTHLFASSPGNSNSSSQTAANGESSRDGTSHKMASTVNVTGLSVDDHFAKALGETWLKLQSETKEKEASTDSQPGSPLPSSAQRQQGLLLT